MSSQRKLKISWIKKRRKDDGFLYFRYIITVESKMPKESFQKYVCNLQKFTLILKEKGGRVIPACDFEDALLQNDNRLNK